MGNASASKAGPLQVVERQPGQTRHHRQHDAEGNPCDRSVFPHQRQKSLNRSGNHASARAAVKALYSRLMGDLQKAATQLAAGDLAAATAGGMGYGELTKLVSPQS